MEITEALLFEEIGRAVVNARVLAIQLRKVTTEKLRLEQELNAVRASEGNEDGA